MRKELDYELGVQACRTRNDRHRREMLRFEKAEKINIKDYKGNYIYDSQTEEYFGDIDELEEYYEAEGMVLPEYVYGCEAIKFSLDMYKIVEDELEDNHYEDAMSHIDMDSLKELQKTIDKWTESQGIVSYEKDYNLALLLNK